MERDRAARIEFIQEMERLFLKPAGLSLDETPPQVDLEFLAGFCSVCDWLGSTAENQQGDPRFTYRDDKAALQDYLDARCEIAAVPRARGNEPAWAEEVLQKMKHGKVLRGRPEDKKGRVS